MIIKNKITKTRIFGIGIAILITCVAIGAASSLPIMKEIYPLLKNVLMQGENIHTASSADHTQEPANTPDPSEQNTPEHSGTEPADETGEHHDNDAITESGNQPEDNIEAVVVSQKLLGDMNLDGVVNQQDVDPFVLALSDPIEYQRQYGILATFNGDINQDGVLDFNDMDLFYRLIVRKLLGDMNLDGVVDQRDVDPFVLALNDPEEYQRQYGVPATFNGTSIRMECLISMILHHSIDFSIYSYLEI